MNTKKEPATDFIYLGIQMRIPASIYMTFNILQTIVDIILSNEQCGSEND